jgi:hypothetical protein
VPAKPVLRSGALGHEVGAMVDEQPDLHRVLVEERDCEALDALAQDGTRDGERVDLIRLAGLALTLARHAHQLRRNADDAFADRQQRLL